MRSAEGRGATVFSHRVLGKLAFDDLLQVWSRKLLETQMARSEKLSEEQRPQAAAQEDTPTTYRGYTYLVGENGVVLKLKDRGLRHFSSEEEAIAYVDSITGGVSR